MATTKDILNDPQHAGKIAGNGEIKAAVERILKKREELDQLRADVRGEYSSAADKGIDTKALKEVVEFRRGQMASEEHKTTVNLYLNALGELPLFSVPAVH